MTYPSLMLASRRFINPYPLYANGMAMTVGTNQPTQVSVAANASVNTKGSWTTLVASTALRASALILSPVGNTGVAGSDRHTLMDIAIGPSGGPTILVNNLEVGLLSNASRYASFVLPLRVPAGSEIIARTQSATGSSTFSFNLSLLGDRGGVGAFHTCTTYGADTATSGGTVLPTPGATNTKGAWGEITAATTDRIRALSWGFGFEWQPGFSNINYLFDIGYGAMGSEVSVLENIAVRTSTNEIMFEWLPDGFSVPVAVNIPAGSRLVGRWLASSTNQDLQAIIYGWS